MSEKHSDEMHTEIACFGEPKNEITKQHGKLHQLNAILDW